MQQRQSLGNLMSERSIGAGHVGLCAACRGCQALPRVSSLGSEKGPLNARPAPLAASAAFMATSPEISSTAPAATSLHFCKQQGICVRVYVFAWPGHQVGHKMVGCNGAAGQHYNTKAYVGKMGCKENCTA